MPQDTIAVPVEVDGLREAPNSGGIDDRRFPRHSFRGRAHAFVFPVRGESTPLECEVLTTDISRGGLSLLYRKQLFPGQRILLLLHESAQLVEVRWCCRAWAGLYAAGCCFANLPETGPIAAAAQALTSPE